MGTQELMQEQGAGPIGRGQQHGAVAHWHVGRDGDGEDAIVDEHRQAQVLKE